jgi:hypothetical protein
VHRATTVATLSCSIYCVVDHCDHGYILLEVEFGFSLAIILGKFLGIFFPHMTLLVQEIIQRATCVAFEFFGWFYG